MSEKPTCPSCGTKLATLFDTRNVYTEDHVKSMADLLGVQKKPLCSKCLPPLLGEARDLMDAERPELKAKISQAIDTIPVATIHAPPQWEFDVVGVVTGQSTMGTGVVTEFVSDFTDFFGAQSKRHNAKIQAGESICFAQMKFACLKMGGNAIVGIDIDYSEVGGLKAMLMVCMSGTAIQLKNISSVAPKASGALDSIRLMEERLASFDRFQNDFKFELR